MIMPLFYKGEKLILLFTLIGLYWLWKSWIGKMNYVYEQRETIEEESQGKDEDENKEE